MLAEKAPDLRTAMEEYENVQLEVKVDGFRAQIHKQEEKIKIFSRRLEDVTTQFPELVELSRICLSAKSCIVDGEIQAIDEKGAPRPFQELSERIHRKYDIAEMVKKIPVQINIFDAIYSDGKNLMSEPLHKRWGELERIVKQRHGFVLIDKLITKDYSEAEKFYKKALSAGHEGIIVKNLDAVYQPGKRVGYWLKVKPIMEPLDLVIIGAEWGRGKRAGWLSSIVLAARDPETGEFLPTGMLGTGLTDEQFAELTKRLKPLIISEKGREVKIKPTVVVEIGYEEIQRSPKYPTGYALRFPRLLRFRDDKSIEEIDTKGRIEHLFKMQK
jgi:DNA ligase-1